jgi:hypothetical protein
VETVKPVAIMASQLNDDAVYEHPVYELLRVGGDFLSTSEHHARTTDRYGQRIAHFPCVERLQNCNHTPTWGSIKTDTVPEEAIHRAPRLLPGNTDRTKIYNDRSPHPVTTSSPVLYKPGFEYVPSIPGSITSNKRFSNCGTGNKR